MSHATSKPPFDAIDPVQFRAVMGQFGTGVTVVTYRAEGETFGMTANAFMSVSLSPPLVMVSVRNPSRFASSVQLGDHYGVSFLTQDQQHVSAHFGGRPPSDTAPGFADHGGIALIPDALAHIGCEVVDIHPAGDHLLFIGKVLHLNRCNTAAPLMFFGGRYQQLKSPPPQCSWESIDGW